MRVHVVFHGWQGGDFWFGWVGREPRGGDFRMLPRHRFWSRFLQHCSRQLIQQ